MNILFVAPQTLSLINGGVRRQVEETRRGLIRLGHHVDLMASGEPIEVTRYDVIHAFAASPEMAGVLNLLRGRGVPLVLSPVIFMDRSASMAALALKAFDALARIGPTFQTELQMKRDCCLWADALSPNTAREAELVRTAFGVPFSRIHPVPNGVEVERFSNAAPERFHQAYPWRDFVLFVGDLGAGRKNVVSLLKAWDGREDLPDLVLIGSLQPSRHAEDLQRMINAHPHIHWIGPLPHEDPMLEAAYAAAAVFILPSRFETPGIAAMEAALAGCGIIITAHGGTREVFADDALYLWSGAPDEIAAAVSSFVSAPNNTDALRRRLAADHDWSNIAAMTEALYRSML